MTSSLYRFVKAAPSGARRRWVQACIALLPVIACLLPGRVLASGEDAHRIVADIAEQFLEPRVASQIRGLLALDGVANLAGIANWADENSAQSKDRARWHYVEIPLASVSYDAGRDCRNGACIVAKLDQFIAVLRNKSAPPHERLEALKYVVNFAADIHQPLHAADRRGRGGDGIVMVSDGRRMNLRQLWDDELLNNLGDPRAVALDLAGSVTVREQREWQSGSAVDWANESHAIAKGFVYRYLPASGVLSASYEAAVLPVALDRLRRAGVRLARVLNRSL